MSTKSKLSNIIKRVPFRGGSLETPYEQRVVDLADEIVCRLFDHYNLTETQIADGFVCLLVDMMVEEKEFGKRGTVNRVTKEIAKIIRAASK